MGAGFGAGAHSGVTHGPAAPTRQQRRWSGPKTQEGGAVAGRAAARGALNRVLRMQLALYAARQYETCSREGMQG